MKHVGSTLTGQTAPMPMRANLNVVGSNAGPAGAAASQPDIAKVQAFLVRHTPREVEAAALSRASQLGAELRVEFDTRFPTDDRGNLLPTVRYMKSITVAGTPEAREAAASALRKLEVPAEARDVEAWLAELSVIVAKRQEDEFSESLRLEAYASRLRRYPADVARAAVLDHSWRFWPAWSELEKVCDGLMAPRRAMINALERNSAPAQPVRERISPERAAEIMREVFGDTAQ